MRKLFHHDSELHLLHLLAVMASSCCNSWVLFYVHVCFRLGHLQDAGDHCWLSDGVFLEELHASGTCVGGVDPSEEHSLLSNSF